MSNPDHALPNTPHMSAAEIDLLNTYIPVNGNVLEFGCGGSTAHFFAQGVAKLTSIDSDANWLNGVAASNPSWRDKWTPIYADIGPVGTWGTPTIQKAKIFWLNYHQECWEHMPDTHFDLILIDGRFRLACLCQSLLRCPNKDVVIVIHDFWTREEYHHALKLATAIDRADSSVVLKRKPDVSTATLEESLEACKYLPA